MEPALRCSHEEAHWRIVDSGWQFYCPRCDLTGAGQTPAAAKHDFNEHDLRIKTWALLKKREEGGELSRKEEQLVGYSPYGWAAGCHCGRRY